MYYNYYNPIRGYKTYEIYYQNQKLFPPSKCHGFDQEWTLYGDFQGMRLCDDFKFGYKLQHYFVYELILGDFGWYSQYIHKGERERERGRRLPIAHIITERQCHKYHRLKNIASYLKSCCETLQQEMKHVSLI